MKTFNIIPQEVQIAEGMEPFHAIVLGDFGRGRIRKNIACPKEFTFLEPGKTRKGNNRLNVSQSNEGWVLRVKTLSSYVRNAKGYVSAPPDLMEKIEIIGRGHGAFGTAGRVGTWDDILLATKEDNFWLRVKPSRGNAYLLLANPKKISRIDYEEAELLDLDFLNSSPTERGDVLIRI